MGDASWQGGDAATAARFYEAAVRAAPQDPVPAFRLGRMLQAMGAHKAAADQFRRVLELQPNDTEAKRQLANTLIFLDDPQGSIKLYREVIAKSGDHRAFNGLGVALDMTGKHQEALSAYRAGLSKQPESLSLKNNLALSMAISGQYENAAKVLRNVAADPRATARHRQNLALVYGLAGQETAAARVARVDLDGQSVQRNLDYYNWLRQQPRWMVSKLLRNGAPVKPQAVRAKPRKKAEAVSPAQRKTAGQTAHKAVRQPANATEREAIRPEPKERETPKPETAAAPRRVDQNGVIRNASLAGNGEPPVRFARLEFGFRPVRNAEPPRAAETPNPAPRPRVEARLETSHPVVVQPRISTPLPVVVRGNPEAPLDGAEKPAERPVVATTPKEATETVVKPAAAMKAPAKPVKTADAGSVAAVVRTQLALVAAARQAEVLRRIEAKFQRAGLEHIMGKNDTTATD